VPEQTRQVAQAAFPKGNPYLTLRDEIGTIFADEDFIDLYASKGQPGISAWRLALVTILQFRENLPDRQAAEAVRARIDWKYLLGLELSDSGFDYSVLSEFRDRLITGSADSLLEKILERCQALKLLKARGKQRTDATYVLAAIRDLNRLEAVGETIRAALNELSKIAPDWVQAVVPSEWYKRYGRRIEDDRLPQSKTKREAYAQLLGEDGYHLLALLEGAEIPESWRTLPTIETLRLVLAYHYDHCQKTEAGQVVDQVRFKKQSELEPSAQQVRSPYDVEARYRERRGTSWCGYTVHLTESCELDEPHFITHVETTPATVHESQKTEAIHQALADKGLLPDEHLVDTAYIDAELLVDSRQDYGISLIGPARLNVSWQAKLEGGYDIEKFDIDWDHQTVRCPQGHISRSWKPNTDSSGAPVIYVRFRAKDCQACSARELCTRSKSRRIGFRPREQYEALQAARQLLASEEGQQRYNRRAGIEGTISQGVRAFGLRFSRYRGLAKTQLQHIATAAAINIDRVIAWLNDIPQAKTRQSAFAKLAPTYF
jgi:transposase